jgi:serine protease Do
MASHGRNPYRTRLLPLGLILPVCLLAAQIDSLSRLGAQEVAEPPVPKEEVAAAVDVSLAFREVAKAMRPSVVSISSTTHVERTQTRNFRGQIPQELRPFFDDDQLEQFFEFDTPQRRDQHGLGSGVIVREDGYVLTNNHLVGGADEVDVHLADGRKLRAEIVGTDKATDIAVLKIDSAGLTPAKLGKSTALEVGEWVLAIGSPFGLDQTVTAGIVSATGRANMGITDYEDFVQTDAAINPGNSGGPLVNLRGEVIGINTAIASRSGGYMGVGFAIPSEMAGHVLQSIIAEGHVTRGWLGAAIQDLDEELARSFNYDSTDGVLIGDVVAGAPAEKAGLQAGDIVTQFNGSPVDSANELRNAVAATAPGSEATLEIFRDGQQQTVNVEIEELNPEQAAAARPRAEAEETEEADNLGLSVAPLTPQLAEQLSLGENTAGVVVMRVDPGGLSDRIGLKQGDVIVAIGNETVDSVSQFKEATSDLDLTAGVRLQIIREGVKRFLFIQSR